jgi:hypothetical protein
MRLPIEDEWKPKVIKKDSGDGEYEEHVKMLTLRLSVANEVTGQQSKVSHETARGYYDLQTKLGQFHKGDLVYIYTYMTPLVNEVKQTNCHNNTQVLLKLS